MTFASQIWDALSDQRGVAVLEYAIIAGLLALGLVGSLAWFGPWFIGVFTIIGQALVSTL